MGILLDVLLEPVVIRKIRGAWSSLTDNHNGELEGLTHKGIAHKKRAVITEFGSGWQGPRIHNPRPSSLLLDRMAMGLVSHEEEDFATHLPGYLLPSAEALPRVLPFLRRNWKAATAIGLAGLYLAKPLSLFSGRDDEANTIEGLRHGGLSQSMRRATTQFGSGWDPLRKVAAAAGLSMEKMVHLPSFKLGLASGEVVRSLGEGSYGAVSLMKSSFVHEGRTHSFSFARKEINHGSWLDTFNEVKSQRKLQDLNAPSVYGWSGKHVFMEPITGHNASQLMQQGRTLPESFISDLENFVPEMHRRGIAHMDMTRDVNRLVEKPKKFGEMLPHNVILTDQGRAAVIDYGMSIPPGKARKTEQTLHQMYAREKFSTNAELDMGLVKSLRKNNGKLSFSAMKEIDTHLAVAEKDITPAGPPPAWKPIKAKLRTASMAQATQRQAREMFAAGASGGRRSRTTFRSSTSL